MKKRHLLYYAFVMVALSSPLFGCVQTRGGQQGASEKAPVPGWIADASTGCKIWNPRPVPDETISWVGPCKNGYADGKGTIKWFRNGKSNGFGDFQLKDGKPNGNWSGTFTWANGDKYVGDWVDGRKHGKGTLTWADGDKYVGDFANNNRHGNGAFTRASGDKYVGGWINDEITGKGTFTWSKYCKNCIKNYVGEFRKGELHGNGRAEYWDGASYSGEWRSGKRMGDTSYTGGKGRETPQDTVCNPETVCKAFDLKIGFSTKPQAPTEVFGSFMGFPVEGVTANTSNSLSYDVTPSNLSVLTAKSYKIILTARIELEEHTSARMGWLPLPVVIETKKIDKAVEIHVKKANGFRDKGQVQLAELKAYRAGLGVTTTIASAKPSVSIVSITEDP